MLLSVMGPSPPLKMECLKGIECIELAFCYALDVTDVDSYFSTSGFNPTPYSRLVGKAVGGFLKATLCLSS